MRFYYWVESRWGHPALTAVGVDRRPVGLLEGDGVGCVSTIGAESRRPHPALTAVGVDRIPVGRLEGDGVGFVSTIGWSRGGPTRL